MNILAPEPSDYKALVEKVKFLEENGKHKELEIKELRDTTRLDRLEGELESIKNLLKEMLKQK